MPRHSGKVKSPVMAEIEELIASDSSPDQEAKVVKCGKGKKLRPGKVSCKVTALNCPGSCFPIGAKVVHRHQTGRDLFHVHTSKPVEMIKYLSVALLNFVS